MAAAAAGWGLAAFLTRALILAAWFQGGGDACLFLAIAFVLFQELIVLLVFLAFHV